MKTMKASAVSAALAEHAADITSDIVVLTEGRNVVAAIVPLKGVDRESIRLSGHPGFLKIISRSRGQFRRGQTISLAEMKAAFPTGPSRNEALHRTARPARTRRR